MFSALQYTNWITIAVLSGVTALHLRDISNRATRAICIYLSTQFFYCISTIPVAMFGSRHLFCAVFVVISVVDFLLELWVLFEIASDLGTSFPLRYWVLIILLATTVAASRILIAAPAGYGRLESEWIQVGEILSLMRHIAIVAVAFHGFMASSSWPRTALLPWLGVAIRGTTDLIASHADLLTHHAFHASLQYLPSAGFYLTLVLWWLIPTTKKGGIPR